MENRSIKHDMGYNEKFKSEVDKKGKTVREKEREREKQREGHSWTQLADLV